jgi:hypothetical protein
MFDSINIRGYVVFEKLPVWVTDEGIVLLPKTFLFDG